MKAYLVWREQEFEKIHDLRALTLLCAQHDPRFQYLRDQVAPLTAYAVRYRYPGPADPTVEQFESAITIVDHVWELVLGLLPPEVRP